MSGARRTIATVALALIAVQFAGGRGDAAQKLANTVWGSVEPDCDIRKISFADQTATLELVWNVGGADWKQDGDKVHFILRDWEGKVDGNLTGAGQIALSFELLTTDGLKIPGKCGFRLKP